LSELTLTNNVPVGLYFIWLIKLVWHFIDFINLYGGPSYNLILNSSPPTTSLFGLKDLKQQLLKLELTPVIYPTFVPVSIEATLPNVFVLDPTTHIFFLSALKSMHLAPIKKF
jgi:hypothetical protein